MKFNLTTPPHPKSIEQIESEIAHLCWEMVKVDADGSLESSNLINEQIVELQLQLSSTTEIER